MPASDEWDLDHGAVWTEVVSDEGRAITLRHPTNPYVDQWPDENPDSLVKIGAAYLRKVRDAFGLPAHLFDDHELEFRMPPSGLPLAWLRKRIRAGVTWARAMPSPLCESGNGLTALAFGSDWPVSTPDPFLQMEVAVTRRAPGSSDGPVLVAAQAIDLNAALAAFTRGSAFVNHDDHAGSIQPGMRADLAVLDRNPFDGPANRIATTRVTMTLAAGRVVHDAT